MTKLSEQKYKYLADITNNQLELDFMKKKSSSTNLLKGITSNMNADSVKLKIIENIGDQIGMTKNEEGKYVYRNAKFNETEMIKYMIQFHKEHIQQLIQLNKKLIQFDIEIDKKSKI
jgi:hypothetical protein